MKKEFHIKKRYPILLTLLILTSSILPVFFIPVPVIAGILLAYVHVGFLSVLLLNIIYLTGPYRTAGTGYLLCYTLTKLIKDWFRFLPFIGVFLKTWMYRLLGAKIGHAVSLFGELLEPKLITISSNAVIGHDALLTAHSIEDGIITFAPIRIGNRATIGARAVIFAGTEVGEGAVIAAGAIVPKNTVIGAYEIWGGVPAKLIRKLKATDSQ